MLQRVLHTAVKHHIPSDRRRNFIPKLPEEAIALIRHRDEERTSDPRNPIIAILNEHITRITETATNIAWIQKMESGNHAVNSHKFWTIPKQLSSKKPGSIPTSPFALVIVTF